MRYILLLLAMMVTFTAAMAGVIVPDRAKDTRGMLKWQYVTGVADTDPTAGKMKLNSATPAYSTFAYVDDQTTAAMLVDSIVSKLRIGDMIWFQDQYVLEKFLLFSVTGRPTDGTGYWKIPIDTVSVGATVIDVSDTLICRVFTFDNESPLGLTNWRYDANNTADNDPGAGQMRFNNDLPFMANTAYLDNVVLQAWNVDSILAKVRKGDLIHFQDLGGTDEAIYDITAAPTNGTGYWKIPIHFIDGTILDFTHLDTLVTTVVFAGTGDSLHVTAAFFDRLTLGTSTNSWRLPRASGTDGQVLKLATGPTPDSAYWSTDITGTTDSTAKLLLTIGSSTDTAYWKDTAALNYAIFRLNSDSPKVVISSPDTLDVRANKIGIPSGPEVIINPNDVIPNDSAAAELGNDSLPWSNFYSNQLYLYKDATLDAWLPFPQAAPSDGEALVYRSDGDSLDWGTVAGGGTTMMPYPTYRFDAGTSDIDPGSGDISFNSATPASVTKLYINDVTWIGENAIGLWNVVDTGYIITIQDRQALVASASQYRVTGKTDASGYWKLDVTVLGSGTLPTAGDTLHMTIAARDVRTGGSGSGDTTVFRNDSTGSVTTASNTVVLHPLTGLDAYITNNATADTFHLSVDGSELSRLGDTTWTAGASVSMYAAPSIRILDTSATPDTAKFYRMKDSGYAQRLGDNWALTVDSANSRLVWEAQTGGSGEATSAINKGNPTGNIDSVFFRENVNELEFRRLKDSTGVIITPSGDTALSFSVDTTVYAGKDNLRRALWGPLNWMYVDTSIADGNPGVNKMRFNNATTSAATYAYVNDFTEAGYQADSLVSSAMAGDFLWVARAGTIAQAIYRITGSATDGTSYWKIPIAFLDGTSDFTNLDTLIFQIMPTRDSVGGGGGDDTVTVLGDVTSAPDDKLYWSSDFLKMEDTSSNAQSLSLGSTTDKLQIRADSGLTVGDTSTITSAFRISATPHQKVDTGSADYYMPYKVNALSFSPATAGDNYVWAWESSVDSFVLQAQTGGSGENTSASNVGNGEIGWFKQETGDQLQFYTLANSPTITWALEGDSVKGTSTGGSSPWVGTTDSIFWVTPSNDSALVMKSAGGDVNIYTRGTGDYLTIDSVTQLTFSKATGGGTITNVSLFEGDGTNAINFDSYDKGNNFNNDDILGVDSIHAAKYKDRSIHLNDLDTVGATQGKVVKFDTVGVDGWKMMNDSVGTGGSGDDVRAYTDSGSSPWDVPSPFWILGANGIAVHQVNGDTLEFRTDSASVVVFQNVFKQRSEYADSAMATLQYTRLEIEDSLDEYSTTDGVSAIIEDSLDRYPVTIGVMGVLNYRYVDTSTAAGDPSPGLMRFNNAATGAATALYLDDATISGYGFSDSLWGYVKLGDKIWVHKAGSVNQHLYHISGKAGDSTGYWSVPVLSVDGIADFTHNDTLIFDIQFARDSAGGGGSDTTAKILYNKGTVADSLLIIGDTLTLETDNDTAWINSSDALIVAADKIGTGATTASFGTDSITISNDIRMAGGGGYDIYNVDTLTGARIDFDGALVDSTYAGAKVSDSLVATRYYARDAGGDSARNAIRAMWPMLQYGYSTVTTDADPGVDSIRFNNAAMASVTAAYIDDNVLAANQAYGDSTLGDLSKGDVLLFYAPSNVAKRWVFKMGAKPTEATGYWKLTSLVSLTNTGTAFDSKDTVLLSILHDVGHLDSLNITDNSLTATDIKEGEGAWDFGAATSLEIPNAANPNPSVVGQIHMDSDDYGMVTTDGTNDYWLASKIKTIQVSIDDPENVVNDTVALFYCRPGLYPGGITLDSVGFVQDEATSYTVNFLTGTDFNSGLDTIEIVTASTEEAANGSALDDAAVAAGDVIMAVLPSASARNKVLLWLTFRVNTND